MNIRGLAKFSLVDYPGKIACVVFSGGCNLRCPFCHNPCLVFDPESQPRITEKEFFGFLESRKGLLEGVVFSGGEPMLQPELPDYVKRVRAMGFLAKIDTNGTFPDRLRDLLPNVDALGIDAKAPLALYGTLTGTGDPELGEKVHRSLRLALEANVELDIRTTVHRALLGEEPLRAMYKELKALGVKQWTLQQYHPVEVIDDDLSALPTFTDAELAALARSLGPELRVRGISGRIIE